MSVAGKKRTLGLIITKENQLLPTSRKSIFSGMDNTKELKERSSIMYPGRIPIIASNESINDCLFIHVNITPQAMNRFI
jgi:hypothetical protein